MNLQGKTILFIGPVFYHYHLEIKRIMEEMGARVLFFPERNYGWQQIFYRAIGGRLYDTFHEKHYKQIFEAINGQTIDLFYLIKGERFPLWFLEKLKAKFPDMYSISYQWDSLTNHDYRYLINGFDKVRSFDIADCRNDARLEYLPLFYTQLIKNIADSNPQTYQYDLLMVGIYWKERYEEMLKFINISSAEGLIFKYHMFIPLSYLIELKFKRSKIDTSLISTKSIPYKDLIRMYAKTRAILDASSNKQTGMSMRVIETLGAGKKLITRNPYITGERIYSEKQVLVLNDNTTAAAIKQFITEDGVVKNEALEELYLNNWIKKCLEH